MKLRKRMFSNLKQAIILYQLSLLQHKTLKNYTEIELIRKSYHRPPDVK